MSLVELLAVIGVIGALMAILIPSIRKSIRQASATVCMHQLHEIHQALHTYRLDNDGWLPDTPSPRFDEPTDPYGAAWFGRLVPQYIEDASLLACPSDPARSLIDLDVSLALHPDPANASSYGMNDVMRVAGIGNLDRQGPQRPLETILLADLGPDHHAALGDLAGGLRRNRGRLPWDDQFHPATAGLVDSWLTARHSGGINILTMDGAVSRVATVVMMDNPIQAFYRSCANGGCPLCLEYHFAHYSFASSRLYWWTGSIPSPPE